MNTSTPTRLDIVAAVGLAIGGIFGLAGTFVGQAALRQAFWADAVSVSKSSFPAMCIPSA